MTKKSEERIYDLITALSVLLKNSGKDSSGSTSTVLNSQVGKDLIDGSIDLLYASLQSNFSMLCQELDIRISPDVANELCKIVIENKQGWIM